MPRDLSWSIQVRKTPDQKSLGAMDATNEIDAMAEACLKAHELVKAHGTPEMKALMRLLLFQIGQEIAREQTEKRNVSKG